MADLQWAENEKWKSGKSDSGSETVLPPPTAKEAEAVAGKATTNPSHSQTQTKKQAPLPMQDHPVLLVRRFRGPGASRVPNLPGLQATGQGAGGKVTGRACRAVGPPASTRRAPNSTPNKGQDMTDHDDVAVTEFNSAVAIARRALEEFRKAPLVPSKRGGIGSRMVGRVPRLAAIAQRWHREVERREDKPPAWPYQDEFDKLDALLDDSQG